MSEQELDPIWRRLQEEGRLGERRAHYLAATESTNDIALATALGRVLDRQFFPDAPKGDNSKADPESTRAAPGSNGSFLVVAESQSRGRGRLGRSWASPPGAGIYVSFVYRPRLPPEELARLTLAAGLAVALALEKSCGLEPGLKWPNDLLLAGKKCGGILCESRLAVGDDGEGPLVVVGIGLNVNTSAEQLPSELQGRATSLGLATGRSWKRGPLLAAIAAELDALVVRLEGGEFAAILAQWRQRDALLGRELEWLTPAGGVVSGIALGPDGDGILQIRDRHGALHRVLSGDLALR